MFEIMPHLVSLFVWRGHAVVEVDQLISQINKDASLSSGLAKLVESARGGTLDFVAKAENKGDGKPTVLTIENKKVMKDFVTNFLSIESSMSEDGKVTHATSLKECSDLVDTNMVRIRAHLGERWQAASTAAFACMCTEWFSV